MLFNGFFKRFNNTRYALEFGAGEMRFISARPTRHVIQVEKAARIPLCAGLTAQNFELETLVEEIRQIVADNNLAGKKVVSHLGGNNVITRHTRLPVMLKRELPKVVVVEAKRIIPFPLEEMVLRYTILGEVEVSGDAYYNILLAAAPRNIVLSYHDLLKHCGIKLVALDLPVIALWRLFHRAACDGESIAVINLSPPEFHLVIGEKIQLIFSRAVPLVTGCLNAPENKKTQASGFESIFNNTAKREQLSGPVLHERVLTEINRSIEFYTSTLNYKPPAKIILSGDYWNLAEFVSPLRKELGIETIVAGPGITGAVEGEVAGDPSMSLVTGLALRGVRFCAGH